jgi:hypothetical protein
MDGMNGTEIAAGSHGCSQVDKLGVAENTTGNRQPEPSPSQNHFGMSTNQKSEQESLCKKNKSHCS